MKSENKRDKGIFGRRRMFEFLLVALVASFVLYKGKEYYTNPIDYFRQSIADQNSAIFSRMISNINAYAKTSPGNYVSLDSADFINSPSTKARFYVNERGWPSNTDKTRSPSMFNQTAIECQQLWQSIFENPPRSELRENSYKEKVEYSVSLNKKVICRYQWLANKEGSYFIDYDVTNGTVVTVRSN